MNVPNNFSNFMVVCMHISYSLQHTTIVQKNMCYTVSFIMSKQLNKLKGNERDVTE